MKLQQFVNRIPRAALTLIVGILAIGLPASVYAGPVGTAFTYQGSLTDGGSPANGLYDFELKLYDAASGGSQVGSAVVKEDVTVTDGFFSVTLDFGSQFSGETRYLAIGVRPGAQTGSFTAFTERQEITPTPYALGLRPGAIIEGNSVIALSGISTSNSPNPAGVYGEASGSSGRGVFGKATSPNGAVTGVRGETASTNSSATGVFGLVSNPSAAGVGVKGQNNGVSGYGVWGQGGANTIGVLGQSANNYGVQGVSTNNTGIYGSTTSSSSSGVYGYNSATGGPATGVKGEALSYGVVGVASSGVGVVGGGETGVYGGADSNIGVLGQSNRTTGTGVWGQNYASTGITYGVKGQVSSASGYPGFFVNTGGGLLLAANDADSTSDLEFKVDSSGKVYADGGYNCGFGVTGSGAGGTLTEANLDPCLRDDSPADFAEMLPTTQTQALEPGDVLAIDAEGKLTRSTETYQPTVVGIYSTRPSYLGNSQFAGEAGYAPLALVGIVPVKVSAENGPIQPGDMLTSAGTPGHAMRAGPDAPQGTVLGKALVGLESGTGVIEMLVMMQ